MKVSIRSLGGKSLDYYKEQLEMKFDYEKHLNIYNEERQLKELKDVEIESVNDLFGTFIEYEGFSYSNCQVAIDIGNRIIYIFDTSIE